MVERILYGVQGEGRGHAARSLQIIQWLLSKGHQVKVLTGGDALKVLSGHGLDLEVIPMVRYQFNHQGVLDPWLTVSRNAARVLGLIFGMGRRHNRVCRGVVEKFDGEILKEMGDVEADIARPLPDFVAYVECARIVGISSVVIDHRDDVAVRGQVFPEPCIDRAVAARAM